MKRDHLYLIKNQPKVKVATPAYRADNLKNVWFMTLATAFAGFFHFFGRDLWYALTGG